MASARTWWKGVRSALTARSDVAPAGDLVTTSDDGGLAVGDGQTTFKNLGGLRTNAKPPWSMTSVLGAVTDSVGRSWVHWLADGSTLIHKLTATKATIAGASHAQGVTPSWATPYLAAFTDSVGRAFLAAMPDGTVHLWNTVVNKTLTIKNVLLDPSATNNIQLDAWAVRDNTTGRAWLVGRANGSTTIKLAADSQIPDTLKASTEVATSRGSRTDLGSRVSSGLNAYGFVKGYHFRDWDLKWTRMLTRRLIYGDTGTQLDILLIGDSYTQNATRWSGPFWTAMKTLFGDAGIGWVGFSYPVGSPGLQNGSVRPDTTVVVTGTWDTTTYQGVVSPDLGEIASSTAGDKIVVTFPAGQSSAKLFYKITAGATVTAQFNGGGSSQALDLSLAGAGAGSLGIATLTAPSGTATTLTVTVTAGTVTLCGADIRASSNGIRVHKIASTGSRAGQWAAVDATSWNAGIAAIKPRLVVVMHGTNDQTLSTTPGTFAGYLQTIINNLNTALAATAYDGLIAMPAENQRGLSTTMASYSAAAQPTAETNLWAFADMQPLFGVNATDYSSTSNRPWYGPDNVHPDPVTGGRVITDAMWRIVTAS